MTLAPSRIQQRRSAKRASAPLVVTVLAGGPGCEREVSLNSGRAVHGALVRLGHDAVLLDIHADDLSALDRAADLVFIALHGEFGEDGTLQSELDARGITYCGSGAAASRLAMNKAESKRRFERAGLLTPRWEAVDRHNLQGLASRFPVPAVVKPVASGSSVDIRIVRQGAELMDAAASLVEKYGQALVERYLAGAELTVGILGDRALPVCEIRTRREFYDYQAKYLDDDTQYLFDLDFPAPFLERVQRMSLRAHQALGCRVFSRVDWRVDPECGEPFILEVNTIPGFTDHSLLPKAAGRLGIGFNELCQTIMDLSLRAEWEAVSSSNTCRLEPNL
jgi:D-alanine-D-alanine ligase